MNKIEPPKYVFHKVFGDFDDLAESALQWNLDLRQLDRGPFHGELLQFGFGGLHLAEAQFGRSVLQAGSPPSGLRTLAVPANSQTQFQWRGHQVTGNDLLIFPRGSELSCTSRPDFHVYTCSFPENLLSSLSISMGIEQLDELRGDASVLRCRTSTIESVRHCLRQLCDEVRGGESLDDKRLINQARRELPTRLLSAIVQGHGSSAATMTRKREAALLRAETYILQNAHKEINVRDISRAAQVSQRTLEYAFVERFGVTPKAFLRTHRLNEVRRELRRAEPTTSKVADIANQWGFWHMGQFASDYRTHFDELPSQTMRRKIPDPNRVFS